MIRELAKRYGYKQETIRRYRALFGDDITFLLQANEAKPRLSIRINTLKISSGELGKRLRKRGVDIKESDHGFQIIKSPFSITSTPEYLLGYFYVQGRAEMHIAPLLNPHPTDVVIDMCAAPGGKTTHLAQLMHNKGVILAFDVNKNKIKALKSHVHRLGITNTIMYVMSSLDCTCHASTILLDAPCTGSGIIRKDPTRKYSRDHTDILFCSKLQKDLLRKGVESLHNNGMLLYSTCSLEPEEDEMIIDWALNHLPVKVEPIDFTIGGIAAVKGFTEPFGESLHPHVALTRRTLPHVHDCNGMFVAKLRKTA
jgi:NOL1/NOP2/sun family putative RNA methylase